MGWWLILRRNTEESIANKEVMIKFTKFIDDCPFAKIKNASYVQSQSGSEIQVTFNARITGSQNEFECYFSTCTVDQYSTHLFQHCLTYYPDYDSFQEKPENNNVLIEDESDEDDNDGQYYEDEGCCIA